MEATFALHVCLLGTHPPRPPSLFFFSVCHIVSLLVEISGSQQRGLGQEHGARKLSGVDIMTEDFQLRDGH